MLTIVADSSPLISLAKIGHLDCLHRLYSEVYIPQVVLDEINNIQDVAATLINSASWIKVVQIQNISERLNFPTKDLHAGEIDAMILYKEISANLFVADDNAARVWATTKLHYNIIGTIGLILQFKQKEYISNLRPYYIALLQNNFFADVNFLNKILIGEHELPI